MAGNWRHNPLTSEAVAFRWLVVIAAGAATVIVVALVVGSLVASLWVLALIAWGILWLWRDYRSQPMSSEVTRGGDGRYRVLVMANQTVRSPLLAEAVLAATAERESEILLVVPALVSGAEEGLPAAVAASEHARQRMELTMLDLKEAGRRVRGKVERNTPSRALRDSLAEFPADEVIVSTLPPEQSHWLEHGVVERARIELGLPVQHVVGDGREQLDV